MIVCARCQKENQDHYKFCLGCGAELPRGAGNQRKNFTAPTPPAGFKTGAADTGGMVTADASAPAAEQAPAVTPPSKSSQVGGHGASFGGAAAMSSMPPQTSGAAPGPSPAVAPAPAAGGGTVTCPNCSTVNPINFKFCGTCGFNLQQAPAAHASNGNGAAVHAEVAPAASGAGALVHILADGTEGERFGLSSGETLVGRNAGPLFENDGYLSPKHANFSFAGGQLRVRDFGSLNGVYFRIAPNEPVPLRPGTTFRIGQAIIRFDDVESDASSEFETMGSPSEAAVGRIRLVVGRDTFDNTFVIPSHGLLLGRERGDVVFSDDGYVSGLHCQISGVPGNVTLTDLGSSNGTFLRVEGEAVIPPGTLLLMGQQLFRTEY